MLETLIYVSSLFKALVNVFVAAKGLNARPVLGFDNSEFLIVPTNLT